MGFLNWLWRGARLWPVSGTGFRFGGRAAALITVLMALFVIVGVAATIMGVKLSNLDLWTETLGSWLDPIGRVIFKILVVLVFLASLVIAITCIAGEIFDRDNKDRPGLGLALVALILAYFTGVSIFT